MYVHPTVHIVASVQGYAVCTSAEHYFEYRLVIVAAVIFSCPYIVRRILCQVRGVQNINHGQYVMVDVISLYFLQYQHPFCAAYLVKMLMTDLLDETILKNITINSYCIGPCVMD